MPSTFQVCMQVSCSHKVARVNEFGWKAKLLCHRCIPWYVSSFRIDRFSQLSNRQIRTVLSRAFDASRRPSKDNETLSTPNECPSIALICDPVSGFQIPIVLSQEAETSTFPSGDHVISRTCEKCPRSFLINAPVSGSHREIVPSSDPDAMTSPLGDQRRQGILSVSLMVLAKIPVCTFHTLIEKSSELDAIFRPFGDQET